MPPKRQHNDEAVPTNKEKLQNARDRRNGRAHATNGSSLKEVDNASVHSGQTSSDSNPSNVGVRLRATRYAPHLGTALETPRKANSLP